MEILFVIAIIIALASIVYSSIKASKI